MAFSFRQLHIFCAVARTGSTTTAAESISLSQSATSAALNELEAQLGSRLFERVGKRLHLNETGRALLPQALRLLDDVQQLQQQFGNAASMPANLAVAASSTIGNYVLPRLLASFQKTHPNIQVTINIANTGTVIDQVQGFDADVGLIEGPCRSPHLLVEPWLEDDLILVAAPFHPFANQGRVSLEALRQARWLLREDGSGTRDEVNHLLLPQLHYLPDTLVMGGSEAIKHSVAAGLGISCLSRWVVEEQLSCGSLIALSSDLPPLRRHFYLLRHGEKFVSPALERFWTCCESFSSVNEAAS
ncbi:LysR family transcriptional regulator [Pseudomonas sp. PH1b]|uniref:LysR family transcriptional regulator n=1 Tax=Pseudomonas sp. PH1b TaxID=1397282 RepID=UPI000468AF41|nr:LysR family transcriptional regulator [Pseudomonas sp. PH1b]